MKLKVVLFYAIAALSLSMFMFVPLANTSLADAIPDLKICYILLDSAERLMAARF